MRVWKTTIEIWSDMDPSAAELQDLARDATAGGSICTKQQVESLDANDAPAEARSFFGLEELT